MSVERRHKMVSFLVLCVWGLISVGHAQQPTEVLDNDAIINLSKAGLSNGLIINKIRTSNCHFDLTSQGLVALKTGNVDEAVIMEMMQKRPYSPSASKDSATGTGVANLLQNFGEAGIYYFDAHRGQYIQLEPSPVSGSRPDLFYAQASNAASAGSNIASNYSSSSVVNNVVSSVPITNLIGNGSRNKYYVDGKEANIESDTARPVFYLYMNSGATSTMNNGTTSSADAPSDYFGKLIASTSSGSNAGKIMPRDFTLYQLQTTKNQRFFIETTINGGSSPTISAKTIVSFRFEKLAPELYRIYFSGPLRAGEYCFLFIGEQNTQSSVSGFYTANTPRVFDFGVKK
jgi:hypothetical protein